jgi:hypothetical protein
MKLLGKRKPLPVVLIKLAFNLTNSGQKRTKQTGTRCKFSTDSMLLTQKERMTLTPFTSSNMTTPRASGATIGSLTETAEKNCQITVNLLRATTSLEPSSANSRGNAEGLELVNVVDGALDMMAVTEPPFLSKLQVLTPITEGN